MVYGKPILIAIDSFAFELQKSSAQYGLFSYCHFNLFCYLREVRSFLIGLKPNDTSEKLLLLKKATVFPLLKDS